MTDKDLILKSLAKKYGLTMAQARDIEDSLRFVAEVMASADRSEGFFPSVRVAAFGLFHCPERYKAKLKELNNKNI
jgi:hypothetical protein